MNRGAAAQKKNTKSLNPPRPTLLSLLTLLARMRLALPV